LYNASDNKEIFPDMDSTYLLSCTILTLNTTFHRDIPNLQGFKKHEFVNMNKKIKPELLEDIYEEIKEKKLDIVYECNIIV
jgi:Sec7-like guanine-nucleotide exchange factor